jgi:SAM-dependent methyltransferase
MHVELVRQASLVAPLVRSPAVRQFLAATERLPPVMPRILYRDQPQGTPPADRHYYSEQQVSTLPPATRKGLLRFVADEDTYYSTSYGSPLSYARALDLAAAAGVALSPGARVLDFGYGYVGHLRLLAETGIDATGVDVSPLLRVLYSWPGDQGAIGSGHVRLLSGNFPADPSIVQAVGGDYDLIISKNVLKRGYIHPDRPVPDSALIHLGTSDAEVLARFFAALKPGGKLLIYNICPAPTPHSKPFVPWSDGRSPWSKEQWESAGFVVIELDRDDAPALRALARALGWDKGADKMDLENDLSVLYTLVQRPI